MAKRGYLKKNAHCQREWYGNKYGGYYVNPSLLNSDSIVYSFGIGEDISFDQTIGEKHNSHIFGFDPTPKALAWIEKQILPEKFRFTQAALGQKSGTAEFHLPKNPDHVSGSLSEQNNVNLLEKISVEVKSFKDIVLEYGHRHIDILKIDVEGTEYDIMEGILNSGVTIGQILIEFHDRLYPDGQQKTKDTVSLLKKHGYEIFGVDALCEVVSFIRKDLI